MTREEAVRIFRKEVECLSHAKCEDCILEKVCDPAITTPLDSEYIEAYGMAIQALSQEPTVDEMEREYEKSKALFHKIVESDDAISRKDVINAIDKWISEYKPQHYLIQSIRDLPSITQKSGKWITDEPTVLEPYVCSECGIFHNGKYKNFCPNCGCRMVESQESEVNNG